eukprot:gene18139-24579_t
MADAKPGSVTSQDSKPDVAATNGAITLVAPKQLSSKPDTVVEAAGVSVELSEGNALSEKKALHHRPPILGNTIPGPMRGGGEDPSIHGAQCSAPPGNLESCWAVVLSPSWCPAPPGGLGCSAQPLLASRRRAIAELIFFAGTNDLARCMLIHRTAASRRRAIAELIFFAGTNDLARCMLICDRYNLRVREQSMRDYDKRTPLHVAAAEGAYEVVKWLLYVERCNVNCLDRHDRTPLEDAARHDMVDVAMLLVKAGGGIWQDGKLVTLQNSWLNGVVAAPSLMDNGWSPEWEVNPSELTVLENIGSGEFGEVFRCKWHGSYVAAKVLKRCDRIALGDFRTEISILRKTHHPNTTQFLGACTKKQPYVLITELMSCSLADAFKQKVKVVHIRRQVEIALDFARGMAYLHSMPIVHRDLKPANLMISGNLNADADQLYLDSGIMKVADFGLSKSLTSLMSNDSMAHGTYKLTGETGSYRYMAPEVYRHEPYNVKVDVYSFAIIMFQLCEGVQPYVGIDPNEAARTASMLNKRPEFPERAQLHPVSKAAMTASMLFKRPDIPEWAQLHPVSKRLRQLIEACWSDYVGNRPSFQEIIVTLEDMLTELPKHDAHQQTACAAKCSIQ